MVKNRDLNSMLKLFTEWVVGQIHTTLGTPVIMRIQCPPITSIQKCISSASLQTWSLMSMNVFAIFTFYVAREKHAPL